MEIVYRPIAKRVNEPISLDDLSAKGVGKRTFENRYEHEQPNLHERKSLQNIHEILQNQREDEKIRCTKQLLDYKYKETPEYLIENSINRKKAVLNLDEMRNCLPTNAPGDKIYKNVDYCVDFFKGGGLVVGSTNSARYNKTVGKKANNFYDTLDLNIPTLDTKKLWNNKINQEEQDVNKDYVSGLQEWEFNYLGVERKIKEEKKKTLNTTKESVNIIKKK